MKKLYSIVLMAAALLVGTNAWAQATGKIMIGSTEYSSLQAAFTAATNGATIVIADGDVTETGTAWFGEASTTGDARSIKLDLKGHTITCTSTQGVIISVTRGKLEIISSEGEGSIEASVSASGQDLIRVYGTYQDIDPKNGTPFTHLVIGENVTIKNYSAKSGAYSNALTVDVLRPGVPNFDAATYKNTFDYSCDFFKKASGGWGVANGVKIDINGTLIAKKYAFKVNGAIRDAIDQQTKTVIDYAKKASSTDYYEPRYNGGSNNGEYVVASNAHDFSPYVHITGKLLTDQKDSKKAIAGYSAGYARWLVEGTCEGSTGLYIKSGELVIKDAEIASNYSGTDYASFADTKSGVDVGGSGIVMQSSSAYSGSMNVTVEGNTHVTATSGYAIDEAVTATTGTEVDALTITGGKFESGEEGAIRITEGTAGNDAITITGGTVEANATTIGNQTLEQFIQDQTTSGATETHIAYVDGQLVISEGAAPVDDANVAAGHDATSSVKWTGATETISADLTLAELEINEATAQVLTIADGVTLNVGRVVLGANAQIIVEAGAKLIVTGEQGVAAFVASNIVLRNEDGKRSIFLFHPNVTSNTHPMATVELTTKSWWKDAEHYQWENFGIPTHNALKSITCEKVGGNDVYEEIQTLSNGSWVSLGYIGGTYSIDVTKLSKPFAAYNIIAYRDKTEDAPKCIMTGELVGNTNNALDANMKWSAFGNSYTAELDAVALIAGLNNVDKGVYVSEYQGNGELAWNTYAAEDAADDNLKIAPMQSFLLLNKGAYSVEETINYANMVYAPAVPGYAPAPRRSANNNTTKFRVIIANEQGVSDNVKLRESATATTLEKYMNDDVNIYAMADEKNAVFASEDLENTYLGVSTVKGGKFTISFAKVAGREFTLVDHETGARIAIAEGNTYEFTAAANSANDYRFEIVESAKLPTAIENTEAVKSAKGVYTITGQYVGEMNVWNTLPAGIYVVNGEKRVK